MAVPRLWLRIWLNPLCEDEVIRVLNPVLKIALTSPEAAKAPSLHILPLAKARSAFSKLIRRLEASIDLACEVEQGEMALEGRTLPWRLYRADTTSPTASTCMVFFHGGGWVIGDLDSHDNLCRALCLHSGISLLSVDYRRAPEDPFPAAFDDARDAMVWAREHAASLGFDPALMGAGGDSAGANIAAAAALALRDQGEQPGAFQMLIYPSVTAEGETESYKAYGKGFGLDAAVMDWFADHYLPKGVDRTNPYVSPLLAESLAGFPPTVLVTAGFDPLRDAGEAFAERLKAAGVRTEYREFPDLIHGFVAWAGLVPSAQAAIQETAELLGAISADT